MWWLKVFIGTLELQVSAEALSDKSWVCIVPDVHLLKLSKSKGLFGIQNDVSLYSEDKANLFLY